MFESCGSRKMLKTDALVAKIGVDTSENHPCRESTLRNAEAAESQPLGACLRFRHKRSLELAADEVVDREVIHLEERVRPDLVLT